MDSKTSFPQLVSKGFKIQQSIAAGLEEDVDVIIYKVFYEFEKNDGPRFNIFIEVWHQTGVGLIFSGRESFREMFEFTEDLFVRVKKYSLSTLLGKTNHPLVRYAAIYLLYSLYFKQPCRPRVKIRLLKEELRDLLMTTEMARQEHHWDVLYAWSKLFTSHAFHYVACQNQMGLEVALQMEQKEVEGRSSAGNKEDYFKSKEFLGVMKKMSKAHSKYINLKANLSNSTAEVDKSLFLTDPDFPKKVKQLGEQKGDEVADKAAASNAIGAKRRGIKYKFYGGNENNEDGTDGEEEGVRRVEENEWTPVQSFSKRGKGGRGRGGRIKGERGRRGK